MDDGSREDAGSGERPQLSRKDVLHLIWQAYRVSFPYLLVFVLLLLVATWVVTSVFY
ncbi:MAG TPA: hypothetical protein VFF08_08315 [Trueperaceae bacterium]|nr:hypothetical protein [Trueperaceae bacterium]